MPDSPPIEKKFKCTVCGSFAEGEITSDSYCTICGAEGDDTWIECEVKKPTPRRLPKPDLPRPDIESSGKATIVPPLLPDARGAFSESKTITITNRHPGCPVFYTLNGKDPTRGSLLYETPFVIDKTTTVKAAAFKGKTHSKVISRTYFKRESRHTPEITPPGGKLYAPVRVSITNKWPGSRLYYSLDDGVIREYRAPFMVSTNTRIRAYATKDGRSTDMAIAEFYTTNPRYKRTDSPRKAPYFPVPEYRIPKVPKPEEGATTGDGCSWIIALIGLIILMIMEYFN